MTVSFATYAARLIAASACACVLAVGACGCAASASTSSAQASSSASSSASSAQASSSSGDAAAAARALEEGLALIAAADADLTSACMHTLWFYPEDYGVSEAAFAKAYFEDFTFTVQDTGKTVEGSTVLTLKATCHPVSEMLAALQAARDNAQAAGADVAVAGAADEYFEAYMAAHPFTTQEVEMDTLMTQNDAGTWTVSNANAFASFLFGGYNPKQDAS